MNPVAHAVTSFNDKLWFLKRCYLRDQSSDLQLKLVPFPSHAGGVLKLPLKNFLFIYI